ncbi:hypothetical protein ASE26_27620 [Duganella sp. Root198D2]|nr:hypothetical protein ASE26_27620 [Duganella sp. Root198D2]
MLVTAATIVALAGVAFFLIHQVIATALALTLADVALLVAAALIGLLVAALLVGLLIASGQVFVLALLTVTATLACLTSLVAPIIRLLAIFA